MLLTFLATFMDTSLLIWSFLQINPPKDSNALIDRNLVANSFQIS